jgi:hypothetical protein
MKKLLLSLFALCAIAASAQPGTLAQDYSLTAMVPGGIYVKSIVYGNSIFYVYPENGPVGLTIQKNDLNGVPVTKKSITGFLPTGQNAFHLNVAQGKLFISGNRTQSVSVNAFNIRVDTATCDPDFIKEYTVPGFSYININDARITMDNLLVLAGTAYNTGTVNPQKGFVLGTALALNCDPVYNATLAIAGSTYNTINSICEISNSSFVYSAQSGTNTFLGRMFKTPFNCSFDPQTYQISVGGGKINTISNPRKFVLHNSTTIFKLDTNLTLLTNPQVGGGMGSALNTFCAGNKIYRVSSVAKMEIMDTTFAGIANSYSTIVPVGASFASAVSRNANNVFITYSEWSTTAVFHTIKTSTLGTMNCSNQVSVTSSPTTMIATVMNNFATSVTVNSSTISFASPTTAISYTTICPFMVGVNENTENIVVRLRSNDAVYSLTIAQNISTIQVFDLNGRMILNNNYEGNLNSVEIDLRKLEHSVYIGRITDVDGKELKVKLLN